MHKSLTTQKKTQVLNYAKWHKSLTTQQLHKSLTTQKMRFIPHSLLNYAKWEKYEIRQVQQSDYAQQSDDHW